MSQFTTPWDTDRARTFSGVGPTGASGTAKTASTSADPGSYRLGSRIGLSGHVYEARNPGFAGRLVIKLFPYGAGLQQTVVEAFTREAGRVANLRHPHIAQVVDWGTVADGTPFIAMEHLRGHTLEERIADRGALPVSELLPVVRGIASGLSAAHAAGIVHRELRPDNVFIVSLAGYDLGFAQLLDFGVSRLTTAARDAGRVVGSETLPSLAPEQRHGAVHRADERTDQFALAALAYRLLTGAEPLAGPEAGPGFERLREIRARPSDVFVRAAPAVETVLGQALSRRPEHRFDSVGLFFRALEEALASTSAVSTTAPAVEAPRPTIRGTRPTREDDRALPHPPSKRSAPPAARAAVIPVAPADSLTQRFFVEGERQEASQWKNSSLVDDDVPDSPSQAFVSFDRVPRRRAPLWAAALTVAAGIAVVVWSTGWRLPVAWRGSNDSQALRRDQPAAPDRPTIPAGTPANKQEMRFAPGTAVATPGVAIPARVESLTTPKVGADQAAAAAAIPKRVESGASPRVEGVEAPGAATIRAPEVVAVAAPMAAAAPEILPPIPKSKMRDRPAAIDAERRVALRGYVWSPTERRLIPARLAPPPTESLPPPSLPAWPLPSASP